MSGSSTVTNNLIITNQLQPIRGEESSSQWLGRIVNEYIVNSCLVQAIIKLFEKIKECFCPKSESAGSVEAHKPESAGSREAHKPESTGSVEAHKPESAGSVKAKDDMTPTFMSIGECQSLSDMMKLPFERPHTRGMFSLSKESLSKHDPNGKHLTFSMVYQGKTFAQHVEPASRENFDLNIVNMPLNREISIEIKQDGKHVETISFTPKEENCGLYLAHRKREDGTFHILSSQHTDPKPVLPNIGNSFGTGAISPEKIKKISVEESGEARTYQLSEKEEISETFPVENHTSNMVVLTLTLWSDQYCLGCSPVALPIFLRPNETKSYPKVLIQNTWDNAYQVANVEKRADPRSIHWIDVLQF